MNDNISVMKGSSTSSEVNSGTPFAGKRIFIKGVQSDGAGTGGGTTMSSKAQVFIKSSKLTMEQLEGKIMEVKEEMNKYVQDLSEDLIKIRDYCYNNT
jgi:hypothetical protein